jgi:hypothetical protein
VTLSPCAVPPWSRRRWFWVISATLVIQVGLVCLLSDRSTLPRRQASLDVATRAVDPRHPGPALVELQVLDDPTLYALPSARGFAGVGWAGAALHAPPAAEWGEPLRWLTNSLEALSQVLEVHLAPTQAQMAFLSRRPRPRLSEAFAVPLPMSTQSEVRVEGDLAGRAFRTPLRVPSVAHSNVLANTVVRVCVDPDGEPFSAVVLRSCGLKSADAQALAWAASTWFAPDPAATGQTEGVGGRWGELIFQWHTMVNSPPGTRSPRTP